MASKPPAPSAPSASSASSTSSTSSTGVASLYDEVHKRLEANPLGFGYYYCPDYFRVSSPVFHLKIVREMMKCRRLAIAAPRESAKSSIASFLKTLHAVCYKHKRHIIIIQNNLSKSIGSLYAVKHQLRYNEKVIADFGITFVKDATDECIVMHKDGTQIRILCKGHEQMGSIRGERFNEWRPDLIICDDVEDDEMVRNPERRRQLQAVFDDAVEPAVDREKGQIIFIGTVLHDDSLIAKVVSKEYYTDYRKLKYKALDNGVSLWAEKWTVADLRVIEANNPEKFAKEYQNDPISGSRQKFRREDFRNWKENGDGVALLDADGGVVSSYSWRDCIVALGCDLAWDDKRQNDFTAVVPAILTPGNDILVDDYFCEKGVKPDRLDSLLFDWVERYEAKTGSSVYIGFEKAKHEKIMKWLLEQSMRKRGKYLIIRDIKWDTDKVTRIILHLESRYLNHSIFHKQGMGKLEEQLMRLPDGVHDDLCLVGETLILTDNGNKRLDEIKEGDFVLTRNGYRKVLNVMFNGIKPVISNIGLTGTPNHPIITKNGIKRLEDINVYDMIYIWNEKLSYIMGKSIIDIQNQKDVNIECISGGMTNGKSLHFHFIDKFGLILLEKFQKVMLSITKMVTRLITNLQILNAYLNQLICVYILANHKELFLQKRILQKDIFQNQRIKQENGIQVQKVINGTANTLTNHSINLPVYNLTIDKDNEYFANGVLVHNCDALQGAVQLLKYPKKVKGAATGDNHFDWLRQQVVAKKKSHPYIFGQKGKSVFLPAKQSFR